MQRISTNVRKNMIELAIYGKPNHWVPNCKPIPYRLANIGPATTLPMVLDTDMAEYRVATWV